MRWLKKLCDRRKTAQRKAMASIGGYCFLWVGAIQVAGQQQQTPVLSEHAADVAKMEWYIILLLVGALQAVIGYVFISQVKDLKKGQEKLFQHIDDIEQRKLDKKDHKDLCESKKG